jgi:hypothetical protein
MGWISMSERDLKRIEVLSEVRAEPHSARAGSQTCDARAGGICVRAFPLSSNVCECSCHGTGSGSESGTTLSLFSSET